MARKPSPSVLANAGQYSGAADAIGCTYDVFISMVAGPSRFPMPGQAYWRRSKERGASLMSLASVHSRCASVKPAGKLRDICIEFAAALDGYFVDRISRTVPEATLRRCMADAERWRRLIHWDSGSITGSAEIPRRPERLWGKVR
jgi:hypothetical protein